MTDPEIIQRIKKGDEKALDLLYTKHYRMMAKMILKNNGTEDEAKDIYQDSLIKFWQKVRQEDFILTSKISTFIFGICQRLWLKELERKKKKTNELPELNETPDIFAKERIKIIEEALNQLDEKCRNILTHFYFDNMPMDEIAEKFGLNNSDTAKSKKYKCKVQLEKIIKARYSSLDFLD